VSPPPENAAAARLDSASGLPQGLLRTLQAAGPALAAYALPFLLVLYLALQGGGYDTIVHSEVGVAVWWIVLLGAVAGILPLARIGRIGWIGIGLLVGYAVWTALGISWSESSGRSVAELARVASYAGILALALAIQGWDGVRRTVSAIAAAIAVVALFALLSRLHPEWFPSNETARFLTSTTSRLSYPLNYWNGLAALVAIGIPLVLWAAINSRRLVAQALAAAALPVMSLTMFFTFSRGGALELAVGLVAFLALYPRRLAVLPTLTLGAAGSAILIVAATQRNALEDGLLNASANSQGDEILAMTLVVCAGVGLCQVAIGLVSRHGVGPRLNVTRRTAGTTFAAVACIAVVVAVAAGVPGSLSDRWDEFKDPGGPGSGIERFEATSGNGRYQYWESALDANSTDPVKGIGPGTYEFWWAREGTVPGFIRDAHSLYFETLAELGIVGLVLIGGLILFVIAAGAVRTLRATPERRAALAAATSGCVVFAVAAGVDWAWELAVLPASFLLLAAAIVGPGGARRLRRGYTRDRSSHRTRARVAFAALGVAAVGAIALPLASASSVRESRADFLANQLNPAVGKAETAHRIEPYSAAPTLQLALLRESTGDLAGAAAAAREATEQESTNWRTWLVLSRIEAERGHVHASIAAYREARSLNPRSPLFAQ
jgi:O-Antigen ligase